MKRWLKRIGYCLAALALLFVLFVAVEHIRGRLALNHYLNQLAANGEELSVVKLEPRHPPDKGNAFIDLARFTNRSEAILTNLDGPPTLRFASPGKAIIAWRLEEWSDDGKTTNNWSKLESQLAEAAEIMNSAHSAMQKPDYDSGFDYSRGFVDFKIGPLVVVKRTAQVLDKATIFELKNRHPEPASEHMRDLVKLVAQQHPEPLIICQLVRQACAAIAFADTWEMLQAPGRNDSQLAALQSAWGSCDFSGDMDAAMKMERALNFDFFEQIKDSAAKLTIATDQREQAEETIANLFETLPTHTRVLNWIYLPLWRGAWADQDELRAMKQWQFVIERERIARTNSWAALASQPSAGETIFPWFPLPERQEQLGWYDRLRYLFSSEAFSINDASIRRTLEAQVQQQMAVTAIAIDRYRLQTGMLPADLPALVPKFLPALPRDSMDGKTLRYRLQPGGGFVLYSVGDDGKDDGGDPALRSDKDHYARIWDGRDAVWPTPATDEEAAVAMKAVRH